MLLVLLLLLVPLLLLVLTRVLTPSSALNLSQATPTACVRTCPDR